MKQEGIEPSPFDLQSIGCPARCNKFGQEPENRTPTTRAQGVRAAITLDPDMAGDDRIEQSFLGLESNVMPLDQSPLLQKNHSFGVASYLVYDVLLYEVRKT